MSPCDVLCLCQCLCFVVNNILFLQDGKYQEALSKWEAALVLAPDVPILHEQKAQVLLEIGDTWNALKAATRASGNLILFNLVY